MLIKRKENIFGDNIAYLESYDFSKANMSNETRLDVITLVASICYQSPKAHRSESLYNRLAAESQGLPSSSFEFVPVLFDMLDNNHVKIIENLPAMSNTLKYGERINNRYVITNYRALVYDFEKMKEKIDKSYGHRTPEEQKEFESIVKKYEDMFLKFYNTEAECAIIAKHFKVFKMKVDMPTFGQAVRHRVNWQVLSRRYVSGTRVPFDFYVADKMKNVTSTVGYSDISTGVTADTKDIIAICLEHYKAALEAGIKPQVARGIIPQCAYTIAWCAMQPKQFNSFMNLRSNSHSQWEIQQLSNAMKELTDG